MEIENIKINEQYLTEILDKAFADTNFNERDLDIGNHGIGQTFLVYCNYESNSAPCISFVLTGTQKGQYVWKCVYSDLQNPAS